MKKKYTTRKLKSKKSYSTQELADTMGVHCQTVRSWRKNGLKPIDNTSHHSLYLGLAVQTYLKQQMENRRVRLASGEFYCLGCHAKTTSHQSIIVSQNKLVGRGKESVRIEGQCIKCGKKVNKFSSRNLNNLVIKEVINTGLSPSL